MDHFHRTKPAFVPHSHVLDESIYILLAKKVFDVWLFPLESTCFVEAKQLFMRGGVTASLLSCIRCNSAGQLGKIDGR